MAKKGGFIVVFNRIPQVIAEVEANAQRTVARVADRIRDDAQGRAPVETGHLRSSITSAAHGKEAEIGAEAEYAAYVEYGTRHAKAQPFLSPAVEAAKDEFFDGRNYFPKGSA